MDTKIEKRILDFTRLTGLAERITMSHGTLYVTLHQPEQCDHFHKVIRTFYVDNINQDGGVNMYAVGDEFAFDFVPEYREAPVFRNEIKSELIAHGVHINATVLVDVIYIESSNNLVEMIALFWLV